MYNTPNNTPKLFSSLFRINRIKTKNNYFYHRGKIDGKKLFFKIDTGSDISILNSSLVEREKKEILIKRIAV